MTDGPLIVQSDKTLLLEVDHPAAVEARKAIAPFAELEGMFSYKGNMQPVQINGIDPAEEEVSEDVALLTEIRDLLATKR